MNQSQCPWQTSISQSKQAWHTSCNNNSNEKILVNLLWLGFGSANINAVTGFSCGERTLLQYLWHADWQLVHQTRRQLHGLLMWDIICAALWLVETARRVVVASRSEPSTVHDLFFFLWKTGLCQSVENSFGCTALDMPEWRETTEQIAWRIKRSPQSPGGEAIGKRKC